MKSQTFTADEDLALELGARLVRKDGSVFNAGGRSGVTRLPVTPRVVEPEAPAEPDNGAVLKVIQDMIARMQPAAPMQMPEINVPAPVVTVQHAQRVLEWTFTFARNQDGTIQSIKAKAN